MGRPYCEGPGLERMRKATPPGLCPFCLDPLPPKTPGTRDRAHCGDPVCLAAYNRCYRRDRRRVLRLLVNGQPDAEAKPGADQDRDDGGDDDG